MNAISSSQSANKNCPKSHSKFSVALSQKTTNTNCILLHQLLRLDLLASVNLSYYTSFHICLFT